MLDNPHTRQHRNSGNSSIHETKTMWESAAAFKALKSMVKTPATNTSTLPVLLILPPLTKGGVARILSCTISYNHPWPMQY